MVEKPPAKVVVDKADVDEGGEGSCAPEYATCLRVRGSVAVKRNLQNSTEYGEEAWRLCQPKPQPPISEEEPDQ